jgi:hypothetical protein
MFTGMQRWLKGVVQGRTQKTTGNIILFCNKMSYLSITHVLNSNLVILVFENTSVTFCLKSGVEAVNCLASDIITQAFSMS